MSPGRMAALLLTVAGVSTGPVAPVPAAAAPVIVVRPVIDPHYPVQVPTLASGETVPVRFVLSSSEPISSGVDVEAWGDGLEITPSHSLDSLSHQVVVAFDVAGTEPGLHEMNVEVYGGGTWAHAVVPFVWTTGSPLFEGTGGLYRRSYTWQGTEDVAGLESPTRSVRMLHIVSPAFAYVGLPARGRPTCTHEGNGCLPYAFDHKTGLLQVGTGIIAAVHRESLYTDGLVPADERHGEPFGRYDFPAQDDFVSPRAALHGTFRYASRDYPAGLTYEKVIFRKDGSYKLAYAFDGGRVKRLKGTFRVGRHGEITFRSAGGRVVQRGTIIGIGRPLPCAVRHTCRAFQRGLWLILSGRKGKHPDGNLLEPVR